MKPSISFVTPNNDKTILIKGSKNSLFEEGIVKFLLVVYPINEEIKSNDEAKEAFNLKKYDISYKKEIIFNVAIKDNENNDELDFKEINNKITMKEAQEIQNDEVNKILFKNTNDTNIKNNNNNNKSELEEKNKNKILEEKINELNNKIKKYKETIENIEKKSQIYNEDSKDELIKKLLEKDNEINNLKLKISRYPFELNEGEKLMCINFQSDDQKIQNYSIICKNTDKFNIIENKLYEEYPDFYETENYFTVNGNKIHKNKSLEENHIHNNDVIILNKYIF